MTAATVRRLTFGTKLYRVVIHLNHTPCYRIRAEVVECEVVPSKYNPRDKSVSPSNAANSYANLYITRDEAEQVLAARLASIRESVREGK
jgi:hypothetical protein